MGTATDFKTALADFETSLSTPIISGELQSWVEQLQKSWNEASANIHYTLRHTHPRQYEEIANEDAELLPRIEQLKEEDRAIEDEREHISHAIDVAARHLPKLEPDESKARDFVKDLVDEGLEFVIRVRKQEVAVETWFVEAFNRTRGAGD